MTIPLRHLPKSQPRRQQLRLRITPKSGAQSKHRKAKAKSTTRASSAISKPCRISKARLKEKQSLTKAKKGRKRQEQDNIPIDDNSEDGSYKDKDFTCCSDDEGTDMDVEEDLIANSTMVMERPFYVPGEEMNLDS
jgi:hypothetical protein